MKTLKEKKGNTNRVTTVKDFCTKDGKFLSDELIHGKGINFVGNIFKL